MSSGALAVLAAGAAASAVVGAAQIVDRRRRRIIAPTRARRAGLARHAAGRRLEDRLIRAGFPFGANLFVAMVIGGAVAASAGGLAVLRTPAVVPVVIGAAATVAIAVPRSADRRHLSRIEAQLPAVAERLSAALSAGLSLSQAVARASRDAPEPLREELVRTVAQMDMGTRLETALEGLCDRVPAHDLRLMVTAILVQRRTGGNLARALSALSGRLEERGQLARELRGATAQARMTAWLVAALPVGGGAVTELTAPGTLARSLGQGPGLGLLVVACALYAAGVLAIRRIGRIEA